MLYVIRQLPDRRPIFIATRRAARLWAGGGVIRFVSRLAAFATDHVTARTSWPNHLADARRSRKSPLLRRNQIRSDRFFQIEVFFKWRK